MAVFLGATGDDLCPVSAVLVYVAQRGKAPGPFFRSQDGTPLTKSQFVAQTREALERAVLRPARTRAIASGLERRQEPPRQDSTIQLLGRWASTAFLHYIERPRDSLAR